MIDKYNKEIETTLSKNTRLTILVMVSKLPEDMLYKIYSCLNPIDAQSLSSTNRKFRMLYKKISLTTKTISMNDYDNQEIFSERMAEQIKKGNRYVNITYNFCYSPETIPNNQTLYYSGINIKQNISKLVTVTLMYKIVNITQFYQYGIKIYIMNNRHVGSLKGLTIALFNPCASIKNIELICESRFLHQIRGLK